MPEFYGSRILQDIFHIFNNLFCSTICKVIPFQTDSVFLVGIVLNILKEMQKIVIICATVIHCTLIKIYFKWIILNRRNFFQGKIRSNKCAYTHRISPPTSNLFFILHLKNPILQVGIGHAFDLEHFQAINARIPQIIATPMHTALAILLKSTAFRLFFFDSS